MTKLVEAIENGQYSKIVNLLQEKKVDPNEASHNGQLPLIAAIEKDMFEVVQLLLTSGADANAHNKNGNTPLMSLFLNMKSLYYTSNNIDKIFDILITKTDPNIQNNRGMTALMYAIEYGDINAWNYAIQLAHISDCSIVDEDGHSVLYYLINTYNTSYDKEIDPRPSLAQEIVDRGGDVHQIDTSGYSLLIYAIIYNALSMAEILISNDALLTEDAIELMEESEEPFFERLIQQANDRDYVKTLDVKDDGSIHSLIYHGNLDRVRSFLSKTNININNPSTSGLTPLMIAVNQGKQDIVHELLQYKGLNINKQDRFGFTALHFAVIRRNANIVQMLLNAGIDRFITNKSGFRAFAFARNNELKTLLAVPFTDVFSLQHRILLRSGFKNTIFNDYTPIDNYDTIKNALYNRQLCNNLNTEYVIKSIDNCDAMIALEQKNGEIMGICIMFNKNRTLYIDVFCTNVEYRGIGAYMMNLIKSFAIKAGISDIALCSLQSAEGFYTKMHFEKNSITECERELIPMRYTHRGGRRSRNKRKYTNKKRNRSNKNRR